MTRTRRLFLTVPLAGIAGLMVLFANGNAPLSGSKAFVTQAEARIGRPLTPLSGAGVARRTTRRAIGYGAVSGAGRACVRGPYGNVVCR